MRARRLKDPHLTDLRRFAAGKECQIRSPVCTFNVEQTVLAHWREIGISGMGYKVPDLLGSHSCYACHVLVDAGRYGGVELTQDDRDLLLLRGMARTIALLIREDRVSW